MTKTYFLLLFLGFTCFSACIPTVSVTPTNINSADNTFKVVSGSSIDQIYRALHATPYELFGLSNNYFVRFDNKLMLQEKRLLQTDKKLYGVPVLSENTFTRVSQDDDNKQVLEFHLTRNGSVIKKIYTVDLIDTAKKEALQYDVLARTTGRYSSDGTTFLITGKVFPTYTETAFLIDVQLNYNANDFISVKKAKRVPLTGISTDGQIESVRYIGKNFYLATKDGGFKLTVDGQLKKLFPNWVLDFFEYKGNIYATGFNDADFFVSSDGGDSWKPTALVSKLKYTQNAGKYVFSQTVRGLPFALADSALVKPLPLVYNSDFPTDPETFYDVAYLNGVYYFSVGKSIFGNAVLTTR